MNEKTFTFEYNFSQQIFRSSLKNNTFKAHLALLGANVIYGVNYLIAKDIMPHEISASAFVFLRIIGGIVLFWGVKSFIKEKVDKKDFKILALCGLFGVAINQLFFFNGLSLTSPIDASIIITANPVLVLIFSAILLKEKVTSMKLLGIAIGGVGAILLILYGQQSGGTSSLKGNLLIFINVCSYALYLVVAKPLMRKYKPITVISWIFLFGFMFMFPFGIKDFLNTNFSAFTTSTYLTIAYVILGTTFLAYLFNIFALKHVTPLVSGSYVYLQPVVSFIMVSIYAYMLNNDKYAQDINMIKFLSCLLVIIGVIIISRPSRSIG